MCRTLLRSLAVVAVVVAAGGHVQPPAFAEGPAVIGGREVILKIYSLPGNNVAELAKTLQDQVGPAARIIAAGNNSIIVYASPDDQRRIDVMFGCKPPPIKSESVDAGAHDPTELAQRLRAMLSDPKSSITIEPDPDRKVVILRGSPELVAEAKAVIQVLRPVAGAPR